ncbi:MAG: GTP-binding protein [Promethearchaeota archaeon]
MLVNEINIKLVVMGYGGVGKTTIVNLFLDNDIPEGYLPTIGNTISRKEYFIDDILIRLNIFDVGGQRSFNPLNPMCFTNVDVAFLVFDLSEPEKTIKELDYYLQKLIENDQESLVFTIGNKLDKIVKDDFKKIVELHSKLDLPLIITSALTGENIQEVFELLTWKFLKEWEKKFPSDKFKNIANKFLNSIDSNESALNDLLINPAQLDKVKLQKKMDPKIIPKVIARKKASFSEEVLELQKQIKQIDYAKDNIAEAFHTNLLEVKNLILALKFTPIDQLIEKVDKTAEQLEIIANEFQYTLEALLRLKKEENNKNPRQQNMEEF